LSSLGKKKQFRKRKKRKARGKGRLFSGRSFLLVCGGRDSTTSRLRRSLEAERRMGTTRKKRKPTTTLLSLSLTLTTQRLPKHCIVYPAVHKSFSNSPPATGAFSSLSFAASPSPPPSLRLARLRHTTSAAAPSIAHSSVQSVIVHPPRSST
jgi:hypothetical protein